jgi:hypothetical protein
MSDKSEIINLMQEHGFYERVNEIIRDGISTYAVRWIRTSDNVEGPQIENIDEVEAYMEAAVQAINALSAPKI